MGQRNSHLIPVYDTEGKYAGERSLRAVEDMAKRRRVTLVRARRSGRIVAANEIDAATIKSPPRGARTAIQQRLGDTVYRVWQHRRSQAAA